MKALRLTPGLLPLVLSASLVFSQETTPKTVTDGSPELLERTIGLNPCRYLVQQERYDLAFQKAREVISEQFSLELSKEFIDFACDIIYQLEKKTLHRKNATIFDPPSIGFFGIGRNEKARKMAIELPDKKEVAKYIKAFDSIRDACLALQQLLQASVKNNPDPDNNVKQLDAIEEVIQYLGDVRTYYVSYNVVSPHLYEAHRIAFIARGFFNDVEDELYRAARLVASGMHHDWIYESTDSVHLQYSEVIDYIKANLSPAQWERVLIETTLIDSPDPSKPRGKKAWLNKSK